MNKGIRLYYEVHGHGEKTLVLLHGALGFIEWFYNQIPSLAESYRLVAMDSRGQGRSEGGDGAISYPLMASDVEALLDTLGIRNAYFLGWSDGAIISMHVAMHRPDLVARMVLIGANYSPDGLTSATRDFIRNRTLASLDPLTRKYYLKLSPRPDLLPAVLGKIDTMLLEQPNLTAAEMGTIRCPTLVLNGADDDAIRPEHARALTGRIPGAKLEFVPSAGHFAPIDNPLAVERMARAFLDDSPPPAEMNSGRKDSP